MIFKKILKMDALLSAVRIIKSRLCTSVKYAYPNFYITLPSDHKLPIYQQKYINYDRFLPHLVKHLEPDNLVIDVGANCGDTLAAMACENRNLKYICIEPDNIFYSYLEKNISRIQASGVKNIYSVKALIGKEISNVTLAGSGGTKHATPNSDSSTIEPIYISRSLDELLSTELKHLSGDLKLLKSDVDGFDYDVLNSAESNIKKHNPMLFFECQCDNEDQKKNYLLTLEMLLSAGYEDFWLFDNFGEFLLHTTEIKNISMLIEYVWRQKNHSSTRTIYYFDILCCTKDSKQFITDVIDDYIEKISLKNELLYR